MNDRDHTTNTPEPHDPNWAGAFSGGYFQFVRDGRWHIHDGETGKPLGVMPLFGGVEP